MNDERALIPQPVGGLAPLSRLAERTLAERAERALIVARTLIVGPGGDATISAAVEAARDGDTVLVRPGRYEESVVVEGKMITIRGDGERNDIVVDCGEGAAFTLSETTSTLAGLTIVGGVPDSGSGWDFVLGAALRVSGGAPTLEKLRVTQGMGVVFEDAAAGSIIDSQIDRNDCGIVVHRRASPHIEANEIWGNAHCGVAIGHVGTEPVVRANRIHDGQDSGIWVYNGSSPRIEDNDISGNARSGIDVEGDGYEVEEAGSDPQIRANRVHDGQQAGICVHDSASPRIEENDIWGNRSSGIEIGDTGSDPLIRANRVHDGRQPARPRPLFPPAREECRPRRPAASPLPVRCRPRRHYGAVRGLLPRRRRPRPERGPAPRTPPIADRRAGPCQGPP